MKLLSMLVTLPVLALAMTDQTLANDCATPDSALRVDFPAAAQAQRHHGTVHITVRLDPDGKVVATTVAESSGHASLDRAAQMSAREYWRFNVANCTSEQLTVDRLIAITYQRPPGLTVSGTLNRRTSAAEHKLVANRDCHTQRPTHDTLVTTCRESAARTIREASL